MSLPTVTCPHCQALLRSSRPVPVGVNLRCPECQTTFLSREPREEPPDYYAAPAPRLFGAPFFIAVGVAGTLGLSIIAAALIYASRPEPAPVAAAPADRGDDGKADLDKQRQQLDKQQQQLEAARLVAKGEAALAKSRFAEAKEAFEAALKLAPDSDDAAKGLIDAKSALAAAKAATEEDGKKKQSVEALLAEGKKAAGEKKYAAAVVALESARQLDPTNAGVLTALNEAKTALDEDKAQKKALADFRTHMDAGKAAMRAERFEDAVKEYMAAGRLMPDDLEAQQGQKQAENKIAALADKQKRQDAFDALLKRGQDAAAEKRFKDAVASLEAAARLMPEDKQAQRALRNAKASLKEVRSSNPQLLARAGQMLAAGRIDDAKKLADQAAEAWAEDEQARKVQKTVEQHAAFAQYKDQAATAESNLRYADAVTAYNQALRLFPDDVVVLRMLQRAKKQLELDVLARREADRLIRLGKLALGRRAYAEAEKHFAQAVRRVPLDETAAAGLSEARYGRYMSEGQAAYRQRKKAEAVQAFEAALAEKPGDLMAANALRQARGMAAAPGARKGPPDERPAPGPVKPRDKRSPKRGPGG